MALISLRQLLDHAAENNYGLPAFNVNNMEQVQAIMQAADAVNSPVILQGSAGARSYAGELGDTTGDIDVVFVTRRGFAVFFQAAVHHD